MRFFFLLLTIICAFKATAQDRAGNDTPGEWAPTHYKAFGLWDNICDERTTDGVTEERCYIRYVDVFSLPPKFAAVFLFVTPEAQGHKIEIGIEPGTRYAENGFQIEHADHTTWHLSNNCFRRSKCVLTEKNAADFIVAAQSAQSDTSALVQIFTDRYGQDQKLRWDITPFAAALEDFERETLKRELRKK